MAMAFLAHGGTNDNNHAVNPGLFHRIHYETHRASRAGTWRNNMREDYLGLVMDLVTWLDRLSGGSTVLIHSPGTRPPGTWALTEEARLDVFLPYILHREQPALRAMFAYLVQYFAQHVATATMERWDRGKGLHHSGPLDNPGLLRSTSNRGLSQPLIPESATPRHVFYGRRTGVIDLLVSAEGLTQHPLPTLLLPPQAPSATSPTSTQTPPIKPNPKPTPSCERKIKPESSSGKPQRLQFSDDGSWTKVDDAACTECSVSELAPSDSASQQQVAHNAVGSGDLVTDLLSHIQQLERETTLQNAELIRLRNRYEPEFDDDDEDAPQLLPPRRSDRRHNHLSSDDESSTCGKGKAPARGSSSHSCLSLSESTPFSPSSTVCDPPSLSRPSGETTSSEHVSVRGQSSYTSAQMSAAGSRTGQQSSSSLEAPCLSGAVRASGSSLTSPRTPSLTQPLAPQVRPFGTITDHVVNYYNLAPQTHGSLRRVLQDYEHEDWAIGIATYLPDISDTIADELLEAMRQDLPLD